MACSSPLQAQSSSTIVDHSSQRGHRPLIRSRTCSALRVQELIKCTQEIFPCYHRAQRKKNIVSSAAQQPLYFQGHFTWLFCRHWAFAPPHSAHILTQLLQRELSSRSASWSEQRHSWGLILLGYKFPQLPHVVPPSVPPAVDTAV